MEQTFEICFFCYYPNDPEKTIHKQQLRLCDIGRWIDSYKFTHPNCLSISAKIWFSDNEK